MKKLTFSLLATAIALACATAASTQLAGVDWPNKPIYWTVPFTSGGNIDADFVAKASGDGYTLLISSIGMTINKPFYTKLNYDPVKNFSLISLLAVAPNVLMTNSTQPNIETVADMISTAKRQPGTLTCASAGNGTSIRLTEEVFTVLAKIDPLHVPYKGSGPADADLLGSQLNYIFDSITSTRPICNCTF